MPVDLVLDLACVVGAFGSPLWLAMGIITTLTDRTPHAWRVGNGALTVVGAASLLAYMWLWAQGWKYVDTPEERGHSAIENGLLLATAAAGIAVITLATWCLTHFRTPTAKFGGQ